MVQVSHLRGRWPESQLLPALHYLHAVGDIVLFQDGSVCTRPSEISDMMAQFISPELVQDQLPYITHGQAEILTTDQVGRMLQLKADDKRYIFC